MGVVLVDLRLEIPAIALRELRLIASAVDEIDVQDYKHPTGLPGWTLEDLVRHVAGVAVRQAEAFHRARFTVTRSPNDVTVTAPLNQLRRVLASVVDHTAHGLVNALVQPDDTIVPLPWAHLPTPLAAYVLLVEYGIHRYDLVHAMTGAAILPDDVAAIIVDLAELTLLSLAAPDEPPVRSIRLEPDAGEPTALAWNEGSWTSTGKEGPADSTVRGPADALALFITGRTTIDDLRLKADDPTGALFQFKAMFPGP